MGLFAKTETTNIYKLFCSKLNKKEAVFLLGIYYTKEPYSTDSSLNKNIIVAQQLLTYLKRNPFPKLEDNDTFEKLFYDNEDAINSNCHPDFFIDKTVDIDIDKIKSLLPVFNSFLELPIAFSEKKPEPQIKKNLKPVQLIQPREKKSIKNSTKTNKLTEYNYKKSILDEFLFYLQNNKKKKRFTGQQDIFEIGIGNGFFTNWFLNNKNRVYVFDDKEKYKLLRNHFNLYKLEFFPEKLSFDGVFSYEALSHMKKDEIIQTMKSIETCLKDSGYLFLSFMYGNGHKVINNEYSTFLDESEFRALAAKTKQLKILKLWVSSYIPKDKVEKKRLNVILQKTKEQNQIQTFTDSMDSEKFPKSIDIQRLTLVSSRSNNMMQDQTGEDEQTVTITRDGRIWITRRFKEDSSEPIKKIVTIERETVEKLFFMIYRAVFLQKRESISDAGSWTLSITATNDNVYEASGSFGIPVLFNGKDVCKIIRETIPEKGLWIFDYIEK